MLAHIAFQVASLGLLVLFTTIRCFLDLWAQLAESAFGQEVKSDKTVIIVGGGFTGTLCAQLLQHKFHVTLIDRKDYFEFTPSILQTLVRPKHIRRIQRMHSHYLHDLVIRHEEVQEINDHSLRTKTSEYNFDYLVLACGSEYRPFKDMDLQSSTRGVALRESSLQMKHVKRILIIGGGLVGVELAAEIVTSYPHKEVTLVHSQAQLMGRFPRAAIESATHFLLDHGVRLVLDERCIGQKANVYTTNLGTEITADLAFLCTGIHPNSTLLSAFPASLGGNGFARVNSFLQLDGFRNVFVGGDLCDLPGEKLAQAAEEMAGLIARNIQALERNQALAKFSVSDKPMLVSLGRHRAIFIWGQWSWSGFLPAVMKEFVEWKTMMRYW